MNRGGWVVYWWVGCPDNPALILSAASLEAQYVLVQASSMALMLHTPLNPTGHIPVETTRQRGCTCRIKQHYLLLRLGIVVGHHHRVML